MSKFKGTGKGKPWQADLQEIHENKHGVKFVEVNCLSEGIVSLAQVYDGFDPKDSEAEYNALLISKAPEMLELLEAISQSENTPIAYRELSLKLIKSATELS